MATKPRHEKTPLQLWVVDNRKRLGLTPGDLAQLTGVTTDTARGWESRGGPSDDALAILERRFGVPRPKETGPSGMGEAGLAQAITALTAELEKWRLERESIAIRLQTLEAAVALLARPSGEGLSALGPPPVGAGSGR